MGIVFCLKINGRLQQEASIGRIVGYVPCCLAVMLVILSSSAELSVCDSAATRSLRNPEAHPLSQRRFLRCALLAHGELQRCGASGDEEKFAMR